MVDLKCPMPVFWVDVRRQLLGCATWYCRALEVPGVDFEALNALPDPSSSAGKALTHEAQTFLTVDGSGAESPAEWVSQFTMSRTTDLIYVVSIGRRCGDMASITQWKKADRSLSNKLANAVNKERTLGERFEKQLLSVSSGSKGGLDPL